jgi:predicted glutamine amidotransferase
MCVLITKPASVPWIKRKELRNCFEANPDGAGFAWYEKGEVHISKGYFDFSDLYADLLHVENFSVMLHCRIATHGSITGDNCHPFMLKNGCALAHNGVLKVMPEGDMTDSQYFGEQYVGGFSGKELSDRRIRRLMEAAIGAGNKMALLTPEGEFIHFNRDAGITYKGIWFSNASYKAAPKFSFDAAWWNYPPYGYQYLDTFEDADYLRDPFFASETIPVSGKGV